MKLLYYYLQIILPIPVLLLFFQLDLSWTFIIGIFVYAGIYRPLINGYRLIELGIIKKEDRLKLFIPFYSSKYISELYLKR